MRGKRERAEGGAPLDDLAIEGRTSPRRRLDKLALLPLPHSMNMNSKQPPPSDLPTYAHSPSTVAQSTSSGRIIARFVLPSLLLLSLIGHYHPTSYLQSPLDYWLPSYRTLLSSSLSSPVNWQSCAVNDKYLCGYLDVPKDYFNASAGTASIAMLKVPATVPASEQLGTIVSFTTPHHTAHTHSPASPIFCSFLILEGREAPALDLLPPLDLT